MLPLLILVSVISFGLIQIMPGDYLTRAKMNPQITQETLNQMRARYGLDKPFYVQYWRWFTRIVTKGDFGTSFETARPVFWTLFMGDRLMWTIVISASTMLLTWLIASRLGSTPPPTSTN